MFSIKNFAAIAIASALGVAAQESSVYLNATQSGLDTNNLGETSLVSYANSSIWIGGIKSETYAEPFLVSSGSDSLSFTSYHEVPTGWQDVYLFPNSSQPVGFTVPHGSSSTPEGATTTGFAWGSDDYLVFNGENNFIGCQDTNSAQAELQTYEIFWAGNGAPAGVDCTDTLYIYQNSGVSTVGRRR